MHLFTNFLFDTNRAYRNDLTQINEKIQTAKAEVEQIQDKINENVKLADERRKLVAEFDSNLQMLRLEITEIESIEYPREADVEVMVTRFSYEKI